MDSTYLEVGIGLAVVFFVVATVADGFNEILSRLLNTRAKALWAGMTALLAADGEGKPDLGVGFIVESILPSWLGGSDNRPRVLGDTLSAVDRERLIEAVASLGDQRHDAAADAAFNSLYAGVGGRARFQPRSRRDKLRWWLEKTDDRELLAMAEEAVRQYGRQTGRAAVLYPPLREETVRRRLHPRMLAGTPDGRIEVAGWLVDLPVDDRAAMLADHLPTTPEVLAVLAGVTVDDTHRLTRMDDDRARYRDADPGLTSIGRLLETPGGHHLATAYLDAVSVPEPDAEAMAQWLLDRPVPEQLELLNESTATGDHLNSAARVGTLLASASISGLDFVREGGRRTKVWWIDGKTFGSALWEMAKERMPDPKPGEPLETHAVEGVRRLAAEWKGTPLGDYLSSAGVDRARSVDQFVTNAGSWFDGQMERLSLGYRRNVKYVLGFLGFGMAFLFNLNAIGLTQALIDDAEARSTLDAYSQSILTDACNSGDAGDGADVGASERRCAEAAAKVDEQLDALRSLDDQGVPLLSSTWEPWRVPSFGELLGMAVTGVAVSFGGVFWYDFLRFLTGVRRRV